MEVQSAFIHSKLDDYGLTPAQFRVFCHIARRGECFSEIKTMAKLCKMNKDTFATALAFLIEQGLVTRESRSGTTSICRIAPMENWKPAPTPPLKPVRGYPKSGDTHLSEKEGYKGNPSKVIPLNKESAFQAPLSLKPSNDELVKAAIDCEGENWLDAFIEYNDRGNRWANLRDWRAAMHQFIKDRQHFIFNPATQQHEYSAEAAENN